MKNLLLAVFAFFVFSTSVFAGQINLNSANEVELEALKGVGPVKAKSIVDYRAKNGPFKSVDELERVPGFGKKTVDKLRPDLTVTSGAAPVKPDGKPVKKDDSKKAADKK